MQTDQDNINIAQLEAENRELKYCVKLRNNAIQRLASYLNNDLGTNEEVIQDAINRMAQFKADLAKTEEECAELWDVLNEIEHYDIACNFCGEQKVHKEDCRYIKALGFNAGQSIIKELEQVKGENEDLRRMNLENSRLASKA